MYIDRLDDFRSLVRDLVFYWSILLILPSYWSGEGPGLPVRGARARHPRQRQGQDPQSQELSDPPGILDPAESQQTIVSCISLSVRHRQAQVCDKFVTSLLNQPRVTLSSR